MLERSIYASVCDYFRILFVVFQSWKVISCLSSFCGFCAGRSITDFEFYFNLRSELEFYFNKKSL